ncbi:MAG: putative ABC transport system permease protein [Yoonia sp.]|jgi:putative ABC transport system permease protein
MIGHVIRLALADMWRDRLSAICTAILISAIIVPLLVLQGARAGVYELSLSELIKDPNALRIETVGNTAVSSDMADTIRGWDNVAFIVLRPRAFADFVRIRNPANRQIDDAIALSSGNNDPYLAAPVAFESHTLVLTHDLADTLGLAVGNPVELISNVSGRPQQLRIPMIVEQILPSGGIEGSTVLVLPQVVDLFEAFIDGYALPAFGIETGSNATGRVPQFERMRLHVTDLSAVIPVQARIKAEFGRDTSSAGEIIAAADALSEKLGVALAILVVVGIVGLVASLGFGFWAEVHRKKLSLATLALMGMPARSLVAYPVVQSIVSAALGLALSILLFGAAAFAANNLFFDLFKGAAVLQLSVPTILAVIFGTLAIVIATSSFAGLRCRRFDPATVLRSEG